MTTLEIKIWNLYSKGNTIADISRMLKKAPHKINEVINKCMIEQRELKRLKIRLSHFTSDEYGILPEGIQEYCTPQFILITENDKVKKLARKLGYI